MTDPNHITRNELAALIGAKSATYVNELEKTGRAIRAPDGKNWLKAESLAAYRAGKDPSKQGVADRWAAQRSQDVPQAPDDADARSQRNDASIGSSYQQARAVKEKFLALEAKRAYEEAMGKLRDAREVEGLVATAMTELRLRLENMANTLAPVLAAESTEAAVRAALADQFTHALESASHHFARLAADAKRP